MRELKRSGRVPSPSGRGAFPRARRRIQLAEPARFGEIFEAGMTL